MSNDAIEGRLLSLGAITIEEMDAVKLMNRVDTKFVTDIGRMSRVLDRAGNCGYRVLEVGGERIQKYDSVYYDTAGLEMYLMHHNGRLTRRKVRTRSYLDSDLNFLEIKKKDNHGRTRKKRMRIDSPCDWGEDAAAFVSKHTPYDVSGLTESLRTSFRRITLVNGGRSERLTIDMDLSFENRRTGRRAGLGDGVIIELKQDGLCHSDMADILLSERIHPLRVSKYCIGCALTDPEIKKNRFLEKIRKLEKITASKLI